jgi:dihydroorotate dehydrogenase electron transfer subunit
MKGDFDARVSSNLMLADGVRDIWLELPDEAAGISPLPGQFAHVSAKGAFLRRPISIAGFDPKKNRVRLIIHAVGKGTEAIASMAPGDSAKALLPLGNAYPFERIERAGFVWLVGGGLGTAPLMYAARHIAHLAGRGNRLVKSFIGFSDENSSFGLDELAEFTETSASIGGFVTDLVSRDLPHARPDVILSCGPAPMLKSLREICLPIGLPTYASLEARMGCGVGACLVCSCLAHGLGGETEYRRVCRDGPVFDISEVAFG